MKDSYKIHLEDDIVIETNNKEVFDKLLYIYKNRYTSYSHCTDGMCTGCIRADKIKSGL